MADTKPKVMDLSRMGDKDLQKLADNLAEQRTEIRLAQNAVGVELELRRSLAAMTPETRKVVRLRLDGGVAPTGEAAPS